MREETETERHQRIAKALMASSMEQMEAARFDRAAQLEQQAYAWLNAGRKLETTN